MRVYFIAILSLPKIWCYCFPKILSCPIRNHVPRWSKNHFETSKTMDYHCWVNLWNIGILWHIPYTSDQALNNWLYSCHKGLIILILSFIKTVRYGLPQVFIGSTGFNIETMSREIIVKKMLNFLVKFWSKWAAKESKFIFNLQFGIHIWSFIPFLKKLFWVLPM